MQFKNIESIQRPSAVKTPQEARPKTHFTNRESGTEACVRIKYLFTGLAEISSFNILFICLQSLGGLNEDVKVLMQDVH